MILVNISIRDKYAIGILRHRNITLAENRNVIFLIKLIHKLTQNII
jgi:hypothetical protein